MRNKASKVWEEGGEVGKRCRGKCLECEKGCHLHLVEGGVSYGERRGVVEWSLRCNNNQAWVIVVADQGHPVWFMSLNKVKAGVRAVMLGDHEHG